MAQGSWLKAHGSWLMAKKSARGLDRQPRDPDLDRDLGPTRLHVDPLGDSQHSDHAPHAIKWMCCAGLQ